MNEGKATLRHLVRKATAEVLRDEEVYRPILSENLIETLTIAIGNRFLEKLNESRKERREAQP